MNEELKPCPICGGSNLRAYVYAIECVNCGVRLQGNSVYNRWNTRADSELTSLREQVRKLTEEIAKRDSEGEELAVTGDHNLIPSYEVELAQLRAEVEKCRYIVKTQNDSLAVAIAASQKKTARIAELELSLAIVGDMAVADWNDEAVGIVDAQVKEPLRYKDQLRSMFAARDKCVELQADNLRLHRLLAQFTGNA